MTKRAIITALAVVVVICACHLAFGATVQVYGTGQSLTQGTTQTFDEATLYEFIIGYTSSGPEWEVGPTGENVRLDKFGDRFRVTYIHSSGAKYVDY